MTKSIIRSYNSQTKRELLMSKKILNIGEFYNFFNPIIDYNYLNISENKSKFIYINYYYNIDYNIIDFLDSLSKGDLLIRLREIFLFLLEGLKLLQVEGVIHGNIIVETISFDIKNENPIINQFQNIIIERNFDQLINMCNTGTYIPPEVYILYIKYHKLGIKEYIDYYDRLLERYNVLDIKYKSNLILNIKKLFNKYKSNSVNDEKYISYIYKYQNTWDNYSLTFLILDILCKYSKNKIYIDLINKLIINISSDPEERLDIDSTVLIINEWYNNLTYNDLKKLIYE